MSKFTLQIFRNNELQIKEAYSELCQTSKMEYLTKTVNGFQLLTIFAKHSILGVRQGSEYDSRFIKLFCWGSKRDTRECLIFAKLSFQYSLQTFNFPFILGSHTWKYKIQAIQKLTKIEEK